jgi:cell division septation protein DedD
VARNEDGELELVLGNTQLLSFFFIVAGLLGVFFAMGYMVGRTSAPAVAAEAKSIPSNTTKTIVVESSAEPAAVETGETKDKSFETPTASTPKQTTKMPEPGKPLAISTAPQQSVETPARPEPLAEPVKEEARKERPSERKEKKDKKKATEKSTALAEASSGKMYLQLSATKRAEAETYVDVLKKKGFAAIAARVPDKGDMYRVLVGPVSDPQVNKLRSDLQKAGFPGDKALRKKF